MTEPRTTSLADIAGIVIDLAHKDMPASDTPATEKGSHLRGRTGPNGHYYNADGALVARVDMVSGPRGDDS